MPLIIDCNNLLHAPKPTALAGIDELGLCRALGYTHWQREGVRVVCDGEPGVLGRLESPVEGVELIYAGGRLSADEVIMQFIAGSSAPRRLLVVSSDRAIRRAAERRKARTWTSEHFARELAAALAARRKQRTDPGAAPNAHLTPGQVEQWLAEFGYEPNEDEPSEEDRNKAERKDNEDEDEESRYWPPW